MLLSKVVLKGSVEPFRVTRRAEDVDLLLRKVGERPEMKVTKLVNDLRFLMNLRLVEPAGREVYTGFAVFVQDIDRDHFVI